MTTYLLDTHILLWWLGEDSRLDSVARSVIADGANQVLVSAITVAEIAIKKSLGKLDTPAPLTDVLAPAGFGDLDFTSGHAARLEALPWHHRDPFDRMLIAQAQYEGCVFVTADERCRACDVVTL